MTASRSAFPISCWNKSAAVEGMSADISVQNGLLVIKPMNDAPRYVLSELLAAITEENLHGEVDTGHAVGKRVRHSASHCPDEGEIISLDFDLQLGFEQKGEKACTWFSLRKPIIP